MRDLTHADLHFFENTDEEQGYLLADRLSPAIGSAPGIVTNCVALVAAAREWACLQVLELNNGELLGDDADRDQDLRVLMDRAVGLLPETDAGPIVLDLDFDDIRGIIVKLVLPGEWAKLHTTWPMDGMAVEV